MTFHRYYSARGTRQGGPLTPFDPTAVLRADHETEMAVIAAIDFEEPPIVNSLPIVITDPALSAELARLEQAAWAPREQYGHAGKLLDALKRGGAV